MPMSVAGLGVIRAAAAAGQPIVGARRGPAEIAGWDCTTCAALCLTVGGWSLFWACALEALDLFAVSLAAFVFFLGLALIPFAAVTRRAADPGNLLEAGR
jgi:hypothetical protein